MFPEPQARVQEWLMPGGQGSNMTTTSLKQQVDGLRHKCTAWPLVELSASSMEHSDQWPSESMTAKVCCAHAAQL